MPRKEIIGKVVSDKMSKTIVVAVHETKAHLKYGKYQSRIAKFKAHDEENTCRMGDIVTIVESRPLSKEKKWTLKSINERAQEV